MSAPTMGAKRFRLSQRMRQRTQPWRCRIPADRDRRGWHNTHHLLCWDCKQLSLVTRSTYGSELLRACTTADHSIPLALQLEELATGPMAARTAARIRAEGGLLYDICLDIDAKSVFESVRATQLKIPSDNSLFAHLAWFRENS